MGGFFVTGEAAVQRHVELERRDRLHLEQQTAQAEAVDALIRDADTDREAAQLVALARLLSPDCWASRQTWLGLAERSRGSNDPVQQRATQRHRNMAALAVKYSLIKARRARDMVWSWGDDHERRGTTPAPEGGGAHPG